jgi:hypothetical protein
MYTAMTAHGATTGRGLIAHSGGLTVPYIILIARWSIIFERLLALCNVGDTHNNTVKDNGEHV